MADRSGRRDERRPPRDDNRNHKPRYEQDRSRSPPRRDRRDDRRRDRSPPRGPSNRSGPPPRGDRDRDFQRSRDTNGAPKGRSDRQPRDFSDGKVNGAGAKRELQSEDSKPKQEVVSMEIDEDEDPEAAMRRIMGFSDFKTTKNTKVPGNDKNYAVHKVKKAEYRQYMNRVGGFNRPLDAM